MLMSFGSSKLHGCSIKRYTNVGNVLLIMIMSMPWPTCKKLASLRGDTYKGIFAPSAVVYSLVQAEAGKTAGTAKQQQTAQLQTEPAMCYMPQTRNVG